MFESLKNKLKGVLSSFSKKVEKEVVEEVKEPKCKEKKTKKVSKERAKKKVKEVPLPETFDVGKLKFEPDIEKIRDIEKEKIEERKGFLGKLFSKKEAEKKEEKGFFGKLKEVVTTKTLSKSKFDELFGELEVALLESNVAVEVVERIKSDLEEGIVEKQVKRNEVDKIVVESLKKSIDSILTSPPLDLISEAKKKKPYIICFFGINGSGKSTTIAKVVHMLKKNKLSCVIAAADTFRAAAIEQLGEWASRLGVKMISHEYGADPAAVAFDAVKYAEAHHIDVVLIDTAGRLHSNKNLMSELQKIVRVAKPSMKLFIGESITGNDCIEQALEFDKAVNIDGIILSKVDVDEKGGTAVSISYVTKKAILYIGTGQNLDDLEKFDKNKIIKNLGL